MKVAELQQHFAHLARLFASAGGKPASGELAGIAEALSPFGEYALTDFLAFLKQADEYRRTGILPVSGAGKKKSAKAPAAPKLDPQDVARKVQELYQMAANPALSNERIDEGLQPLDGLTKAGLVNVAKAIQLKPPSSAKVGDIRTLIRQTIVDRRGSAQRAGMTALPQ